MRRKKITVRGIVQGVGFRPFVFRLATECGLAGEVYNNGNGVEIDIQGERIDEFINRLSREAPPLIMMTDIEQTELPVRDVNSFRIIPSEPSTVTTAYISPDIALCNDCLRELLDRSDRRYEYPFINCTNCGPRYTITETIPYDRGNTSMRVFPMCPRCEAEYHDAADRRFHAQPNACPSCGPSLRFHSNRDLALSEIQKANGRDFDEHIASPDDPFKIGLNSVSALETAADFLQTGKVVAVRGLGGYHLAVDATNSKAVALLRERKRRFEKPLAVMVPDIETAKAYCVMSDIEERLLISPEHPIVVLERKSETLLPRIAEEISPGNPTIGLFLPYTPLHHLLFRKGFHALVMTSANLSEEPICIAPDEAERRLGNIADGFLHHNRDILQRCDDSVLRVMSGAPRLIRRSRGYVPKPVLLKNSAPSVLAVGAELKNTVCVTKERAAFISQHIGDLENIETLSFFEEAVSHLLEIFEIVPEGIAHDMHPDYLGTQWALSPPNAGRWKDLSTLPLIPVQHHHAHLVSCLAENGRDEEVIGAILDGTGYGLDGASWGGEFLIGNSRGFTRVGHFETMRMPGGTLAIKQPWRMAYSYLVSALGFDHEAVLPDFYKRRTRKELEAVRYGLESGLNAPLTSSCGRFFDACASFIGLYDSVRFEAQAAIALEHLAAKAHEIPYEYEIRTHLVDPDEQRMNTAILCSESTPGIRNIKFELSFIPAIRQLVHDLRKGIDKRIIAARIHRTVINACLSMAQEIALHSGIKTVALSGGVFQNSIIFEGLFAGLEENGFHVLTHQYIPANDAGLSLGQAVIAQSILKG